MDIEKSFESIIKSNKTKHEKLAEILKKIIDACNIEPDSYFILGSYALREYREINDLDLNMDEKEFDKLVKCAPYGKKEIYNNQIRWFFDLTDKYKLIDPTSNDFSIEIFKKKPLDGFPNENYSLQRLKENNGLDKDKYGHQFFNLKTLLSWKKTMNRPKDQQDIIMIEKIIKDKQIGGYYLKYLIYKKKYLNLKKTISPFQN